MHKTNHNKNIFLFATIWVSVSEMLTHPNKFICSKVNSMYTGLQADTHSGTPSRQSYLFFTSQEKKKVQRKHASRNNKITLSSAKLQGRINDASWPGNTENVQILSAAGFVWLFCHFFFFFFLMQREYAVLFSFELEVLRTQPPWFGLHQWKEEKDGSWRNVRSCHTCQDAFVTSQIWSTRQQSEPCFCHFQASVFSLTNFSINWRKKLL